MKAIETTGMIDQKGILKLNKSLNFRNRNVRIIILVDEKKDEEENSLWLRSISSNPAFDFLKDIEEDIYSLSDGKPFND
jgi:hypothetical protein